MIEAALRFLGSAVGWLMGNFWRTMFLAAMALAGVMWLQKVWLSDDLEEANVALQKAQDDSRIALSANKVNEATIEALRANRDALMAARAAERAEADALLAQAEELAANREQRLARQRKEIDNLSRLSACSVAMMAPICPDIERVLRTP
jgi:hypothetical protein